MHTEINKLPSKVMQLVEALSKCTGVVGVVLGGSRARGRSLPSSDIDIGVYYEKSLFDWPEVARVLTEADTGEPNGLAAPGAWGPWMNGGGWLKLDTENVDVLLRDAAFVSDIAAEVFSGHFTSHYLPGHPHGWHSFMLVGELHYNIRLRGGLAGLTHWKDKLTSYPAELRNSVVERFSYEARFTSILLSKLEGRGDDAQVSGLAYRGLMCLVHAVCAINGLYVVNEKGLLNEASTLDAIPKELLMMSNTILDTRLSPTARATCLLHLLNEVLALAERAHSFKPAWNAKAFPHN